MIIKYPDGKNVKLIFDEKSHKYKVGEDLVPSVTKIIDNIVPVFLTRWAANEGAVWFRNHVESMVFPEDIEDMVKGIEMAHINISKAALNIGKKVHNYIEEVIEWSLDSGNMPEMPEEEEAVNSIKAFGEWVRANDVEWISTEERIYSRKYGFAGTVDALALIDDRFCVIDFKTSKQIYKSYKLQVYAYKQAVQEMYGREVEGCWILRFDKATGKFQAREIKENYLPAFIKGLDFYNEYRSRR